MWPRSIRDTIPGETPAALATSFWRQPLRIRTAPKTAPTRLSSTDPAWDEPLPAAYPGRWRPALRVGGDSSGTGGNLQPMSDCAGSMSVSSNVPGPLN
jgi:hypothetical protein